MYGMSVQELLGQTLTSVENRGDEAIVFATTEGKIYRLFHRQDCCESVNVEDICGDLADLVGSPILEAEEMTSNENPPDAKQKAYPDESFTWTFYKFATIKGSVTIRWYGSSNGYYSESVDFQEIT